MTWRELELRGGDGPGERGVTCDGEWFTRLLLLRCEGQPITTKSTDEEECGLLVLAGTVDLVAGAGSWISRGTRSSPFDGKPVAVFLPPKTQFGATGGAGEMLVVATRRPAPPRAEAPAGPAKKPLLPLAGSNKAYDGATGSWQPLESFPDSAEAILPRRITTNHDEGVRTHAVFADDYKARGLTLHEVVIESGREIALSERPAREGLIFYRAEGRLTATGDGTARELTGEGILFGSGELHLRAEGGRAYCALAGSGPKSTT